MRELNEIETYEVSGGIGPGGAIAGGIASGIGAAAGGGNAAQVGVAVVTGAVAGFFGGAAREVWKAGSKVGGGMLAGKGGILLATGGIAQRD